MHTRHVHAARAVRHASCAAHAWTVSSSTYISLYLPVSPYLSLHAWTVLSSTSKNRSSVVGWAASIARGSYLHRAGSMCTGVGVGWGVGVGVGAEGGGGIGGGGRTC